MSSLKYHLHVDAHGRVTRKPRARQAKRGSRRLLQNAIQKRLMKKASLSRRKRAR